MSRRHNPATARKNRQRLFSPCRVAADFLAFVELAFRMQVSVPDVMDIRRETPQTPAAYGARPDQASFANNCLLARRLVERGVRFVQLYN